MITAIIATPERHVLGPVEMRSLTVPGDKGEMTLLPGHARLISTLSAGTLVFETATGEKKTATISGGFLEIHADRAVVLADTFEL